MEHCGSTVNLIDTKLQPEKKRYSAKHIMVSAKDSEGAQKQEKQNGGSGYICVLFVAFLMFVTIIAMTSIGAVYITHIQEHVARLELRVRDLELRPCGSTRQGDDKPKESLSAKTDTFGAEQRIKRASFDVALRKEGSEVLRVKRDTAEETHAIRHRRSRSDIEDDHLRQDHHGIPAHNIALVFGDPDKIDVNEKTAVGPEHRFRNMTEALLFDKKMCGTVYERTDGQLWCPMLRNMSNQSPPRYQTSKNNHDYHYFKKASWMNRTKSIENYNLTHNGKLAVRQAGIYIVHASIVFAEVGPRDTPEYGVYKTDGLGKERKLLSKCMVTPPKKSSSDQSPSGGKYPCQAWQLAHLNSGDKVFLSITGYTWFEIERETFHLALIKLNDFEL